MIRRASWCREGRSIGEKKGHWRLFAGGLSNTKLVFSGVSWRETSFTDIPVGIVVNLLTLLALTHLCFPEARRHTRKFFELSYYNPKTGEYCAGWNDAFTVFFWIVVFTGLRAAVIDYLLTPLANWAGVKTERDQTRFAEQAWLLLYYSVFWTLGAVRSFCDLERLFLLMLSSI